MDFRLSEDQEALQESIRSFLEAELPIEKLGELAQSTPFDRDLWRELAEMGVFGLRLSEAQGGVGLGMADAVVVNAELGRRLVPGPLVWTQLAAEWIPEAASGDAVVGGVDLTESEAGPFVVEHFDALDVLLVLRPQAVERVDPKSLQATSLGTPFDPLTPAHRIDSLPSGETLAGSDAVERLQLEGAVLSSALLLGITESTHELAVEYSKGREQFGRPIGSFQSIKHMLSDTFVRQEVARAAAYAAGATLDDPTVGDVARAASAAKLNAGESALKNSRACIQVYGGMGFTWEMPPHYFWKRAWVLENGFGTVDHHAERIAAHLDAA